MSIAQSIRAQIPPIHPEGYPFIGGFALASLILFWIWTPLGWIGTLLTVWCALFFRDPVRVTPVREGLVVSPADGRVSMVAPSRRYHVALVDPIPAGLEPMNPRLAVTGPIPTDPKEQQSRGKYWWWYGPWYEHQNLRDERAEAFTQLLYEGVHKYDYVARATTPGTFVVPPPKAEEMYMPETFGRGASDRVVVE